MAQVVLGAVGAAVGTMVGVGPQVGWMVGTMVGALLFPPKGPDGPRLGDLSVQASTYGIGIPRLWGTTRVAGNVIWSTDLVEHAHEEDGKGGPSYTTYTYTCSFAVSFGEGEIAGIRRLWADGKLIYDVSASNTGPTSDYAATGLAIYTGAETQNVDPTIQAHMGAAPAYRGLAYLVFSDLQLEKFGNRIPMLSAEIATVANTTLPPPEVIGSGRNGGAVDPDTGYLWTVTDNLPAGGQSTVYVNDPATKTVLRAIVIDLSGNQIAYIPGGEFWVPSNNPAMAADDIAILSAAGMALVRYVDWSNAPTAWPGAIGYAGAPAPAVYIGSVGGLAQVAYHLDPDGTLGGLVDGYDGWARQFIDLPEYRLMAVQTWHGTVQFIDHETHAVIATFSAPEFAGDAKGIQCIAYDPTRGRIMWAAQNAGTYCYVIDITLRTVTKTSIAWPQADVRALIYHPGLDIYVAMINTAIVTVNPETFAVDQVIEQGVSAGKLFVAAGYTDRVYGLENNANNLAWVFHLGPRLDALPTPLSGIVSDLSLACGLTAGDIDVTALTELVDGYAIANPGAARSAIEQIMMAYPFDAVESGGKVKFVKRGNRPARTLAADDLGLHEAGQDVPAALPLKRADEVELPRSITLKYVNPTADYQISAQRAARQSGRSVSDVVWELPVVMSDAHAKAVADQALYSAWTARTSAKWSTSLQHADLEPTDVVAIDGNAIRITRRALRGNILDFEGVFDSGQVFVSGAAAGTAYPVSQTIRLRSATALVLMDIPLLRDQDDGAGFYLAAGGYPNQDWPGCMVFRSSDGGASWEELHTLTTASAAGVTSTALANVSANVFDESSTVNVTLRSGQLASVSELAVLNGANAALIGNEIVQFRTATLETDGSYTLSGLLRGRKGSPTDGHAAGERFVLLTHAGLRRVPMATAEIGLERLYKAVTLGATLSSAQAIAFTNTAIGLECLSPVQLGGGRDAAGNLTIQWVRRTRTGGEWRDNVDAALGETSEAYEVEIWDAGFATLKRTLTGLSAPAASYSAANQTADFGGTQAAVHVRVYQLSASVGRGFALQGSV